MADGTVNIKTSRLAQKGTSKVDDVHGTEDGGTQSTGKLTGTTDSSDVPTETTDLMGTAVQSDVATESESSTLSGVPTVEDVTSSEDGSTVHEGTLVPVETSNVPTESFNHTGESLHEDVTPTSTDAVQNHATTAEKDAGVSQNDILGLHTGVLQSTETPSSIETETSFMDFYNGANLTKGSHAHAPDGTQEDIVIGKILSSGADKGRIEVGDFNVSSIPSTGRVKSLIYNFNVPKSLPADVDGNPQDAVQLGWQILRKNYVRNWTFANDTSEWTAGDNGASGIVIEHDITTGNRSVGSARLATGDVNVTTAEAWYRQKITGLPLTDGSTTTVVTRLIGNEQLVLQMDENYHNEPTIGQSKETSGNNLHANLKGGLVLATAKHLQGYTLNGTDAYLHVPRSTLIEPTSQITVMAWVKSGTSTWNSDGWILSKRQPSDDTLGYILHPMAGSKEIRFYLGFGGAWDSVAWVPDASFDITQWHHYCGVYDGSAIRLYVDGVEKVNKARTGSIDHGSEPGDLYIGRDEWGGNYRYGDGIVDEVRIYDVGLTTTQTQDIMNDPYDEVNIRIVDVEVAHKSSDVSNVDETANYGRLRICLDDGDGTVPGTVVKEVTLSKDDTEWAVYVTNVSDADIGPSVTNVWVELYIRNATATTKIDRHFDEVKVMTRNTDDDNLRTISPQTVTTYNSTNDVKPMYLYKEDFEAYTAGEHPSNWGWYTMLEEPGTSNVIDADEGVGTTQALKQTISFSTVSNPITRKTAVGRNLRGGGTTNLCTRFTYSGSTNAGTLELRLRFVSVYDPANSDTNFSVDLPLDTSFRDVEIQQSGSTIDVYIYDSTGALESHNRYDLGFTTIKNLMFMSLLNLPSATSGTSNFIVDNIEWEYSYEEDVSAHLITPEELGRLVMWVEYAQKATTRQSEAFVECLGARVSF